MTIKRINLVRLVPGWRFLPGTNYGALKGHKASLMMCGPCLNDFFHGRLSKEITLVLSDEEQPNSYKLTHLVLNTFKVWLSDGTTEKVNLYYDLYRTIIRNFGTQVWLSIEG